MAHHRVSAVIVHLRCEPAVERRDQLRVGGSEADASPVAPGGIGDRDPFRPCLKLHQPRHAAAMDPGGVRVVAASERGRLFAQVRSNAGDQRGVAIVNHDDLYSAICRRCEEVHRSIQIERHDYFALLVDRGLVRRRRRSRADQERCGQGDEDATFHE